MELNKGGKFLKKLWCCVGGSMMGAMMACLNKRQPQNSHVCQRNRTFRLTVLKKNQSPHYKGDEVKETENKEYNS